MASKYQPMASYAAIADFIAKGRSGTWRGFYDMSTEQWTILEKALREAHHFVFDFSEGNASKDTSVVSQFTIDCVTAGIFQPPFDVTLLQWPMAGNWRYGACLIITIVRNRQATKWVDIGLRPPELEGGATENCVAVVFGFAAHITQTGLATYSENYRQRVQGRENTVVVLSTITAISSWPSEGETIILGDGRSGLPVSDRFGHHFITRKLPASKHYSEQENLKMARWDSAVAMRAVLYYMGVLGSRGATKRDVAPDPKVAGRRIEEGRDPWVSYSLISIPVGGEREWTSAGRTVNGHRSPRQHWRRGHIRHLRNDDGEIVKRIPIPPCLVGASETRPRDCVLLRRTATGVGNLTDFC